ncbi:MAG: DUF262 domain-containing protein [Verrucomicrobia bacterium]|jgi:hypothetical protein|nr:DUF262 domain-containing protein [Verrucomicrobiota bacterium]
MSNRITGSEFSLADIFSKKFEYFIPSYQRPYAWTTDQTSELFDDLYDFFKTESDEGYFLGSIVLIKKDGDPKSEVIDGQQRLTTITILLSAIASRIEGDDRKELLAYIVEPGKKYEGIEAKPRLTLRDRDRVFFEKYVQGLQFDLLMALGQQSLANESQRNIQLNSECLLKRMEAKFSNDPVELDKFVQFVLGRCFIIAVSTPSQQSAFRVFSVMNSRGLDLQPTDIIKADLIGQIADSEQPEYNERWEDLEVELGRSGFNDLFAYVRMIYAKDKAKKALLEEFRTHVLPRMHTPESLISETLEPFGEALHILKEGNYRAETDAQQANNYLRWLNRIDNSDWIPPAMLFLAQKKDDPEYVLWFFERMERLAAFMHICAYNVNWRIDRYAEVIEGLESDHNLNNPVHAVELTEAEMKLMRERLDSEIYTLTARRRNYLILRLDSFVSDGGATYDASILTIEHVLPQTVDSASEWAQTWPEQERRNYWIHRLGNLVPLNMRRNPSASNYDFKKKKEKYFKGSSNVTSYALTSQVTTQESWTEEDVKKRQSDLLEVLFEKWRLTANN